MRTRPDKPGTERRLQALVRNVRAAFVKIVEHSENIPDELKDVVTACEDAGRIADIVCANVDLRSEEHTSELQSH